MSGRGHTVGHVFVSDDRVIYSASDLAAAARCEYALLRSFDNERILRAFAAVDRALNALDRNASPKIVADWLAFQI